MKAALLWLAVVATASSAAEPGRGLQGEWWTPGFNARVRIEACGADAVCGRIVWLWDDKPQGIADKTPLIGKPVIDQMKLSEPGQWNGGRLYNPEDGRDYKGSLQLRSDTTLVVSGCVLFVCQTQVWRRADAGRCPPVAPP
jgi:Delta7-sterol 5-desaturase